MMKKLYIKTTMDKYELPIAVADSPLELATFLGMSKNTVSSSISHKYKGWSKVEVDFDESEVYLLNDE